MPRRKEAPPHGWIDRKTGQLYAVLNYTDKHGKRRQKFRKAQDSGHVRELYAEMVKTIAEKGEDALNTHKKTFNDLAAFYRKHYVKEAVYNTEGRKISGFRRKITDVENEINVARARFGKEPLRSITFEDIQTFRDNLYITKTRRGTLPAVSTVNHFMKRVRTMLNVAVRKGWLDRNPASGGEKLVTAKGETERTRRLLPGEEERLLSQCIDTKRKGRHGEYQKLSHMRAIIIIAIDTAMRQGELLFKLRKPQVDFEHNTITVVGQWGGTKDMRTRYVPLTPRLKVELEKLFKETEFDPEGPVFNQKSCDNAFERVCALAGIVGLTFHDLRHEGTFRILDVCRGNHVQAMKITGHTQMSTFMRYINIDKKTVQQIAEGLAALQFEQAKPEAESDTIN